MNIKKIHTLCKNSASKIWAELYVYASRNNKRENIKLISMLILKPSKKVKSENNCVQQIV